MRSTSHVSARRPIASSSATSLALVVSKSYTGTGCVMFVVIFVLRVVSIIAVLSSGVFVCLIGIHRLNCVVVIVG